MKTMTMGMLGLFFVMAGLGFTGCMTGNDGGYEFMTPQEQAERTLDKIDGWLTKVEKSIIYFGLADDRDGAWKDVLFMYDLFRPDIVDAIAGSLAKKMTVEQTARLQSMQQRLDKVDAAISPGDADDDSSR